MIKQSAIEKLGLKQMKRDFYDPGGVINKPEWNIALWPGMPLFTNFAIFREINLFCCNLQDTKLPSGNTKMKCFWE